MESFRLETMGDLRESDYNPRDIKRAALEGLKVSIEAFGDLSGVVWNARLRQKWGSRIVGGIVGRKNISPVIRWPIGAI